MAKRENAQPAPEERIQKFEECTQKSEEILQKKEERTQKNGSETCPDCKGKGYDEPVEGEETHLCMTCHGHPFKRRSA